VTDIVIPLMTYLYLSGLD